MDILYYYHIFYTIFTRFSFYFFWLNRKSSSSLSGDYFNSIDMCSANIDFIPNQSSSIQFNSIFIRFSLSLFFFAIQMGISRSSTCAIAYLMIYRKMTAADAIRTCRLRRDIFPNVGFLQQLADLCNELRRERQYSNRFY